MPNIPNYYARLGLPLDATPEEIRRAYRLAARRLHPDTREAGETKLFLDVQEAYETLSDPHKRMVYDDQLPPEYTTPPAVTITTLFSRASLPRVSEPQLIYALLELSAQPSQEESTTTPVNLALVLDCSTSMQGAAMDTVKATAIELVRQLRPNDLFSLIAFSDRAQVLVPAGSQQDHAKIETAIRMIQPSGATEIFRGLEAGFSEVRRYRSSKYTNHIILITDGRTYGDEAQCMQLAEDAVLHNIGISALGIGGQWNDVFLDDLTKHTGGSSMYVAKPRDIRRFLIEKFSGLGQSYAERVIYDCESGAGVQLRYAFRLQPETSPLEINPPLQMGNIPRDISLSVLMEFLVESVPPDAASISLCEGRLTLNIPSRAEPTYTVRLNLSRPTTNEADNEPPPAAIVQAMSRLTLYRMQERARQHVAEGNVREATRRLQNIATHLLSQGNYELAKTILSEADNLQHTHAFSEEGEKRIKYGTRGLLLPASVEEKPQ